jgi:hypothetical protein
MPRSPKRENLPDQVGSIPTPTTVLQRPDGRFDDGLIHECVVCPHHGPTGVGLGMGVEIYAVANSRDDWIALLERCHIPDCIMNRFNEPRHRERVPKYRHWTGSRCETGATREDWEKMEWVRIAGTSSGYLRWKE